MSYSLDDMMLDIQLRVPLKDIREKVRADVIAEANRKHNIECSDCVVRQIATVDEARIRADERGKVLKAVIDCGWHCEIHSDKALYEMVDKQLKEGEQNV